MTTTDTLPPPISRALRRSRTDRVGAGVAGGLGEYFALDPVLFRVLFATAAFFGGAGILAYLLAWAAIPEDGTGHAPIDGWVRSMRQRRFPAWIAVAAAVLLLWAVAFSWWAPGPVFPVLIVALVLYAAFVRRDGRSSPPVDLTKPAADGPTWVHDTREWITESREQHRTRRRRAAPVRRATLGVLAVTLVVLALVDAARGIVVPTYFFVAGGIVLTGLLVGLVLRRAPLGLLPLLIPSVVGAVAFAGSGASLHDGMGQRDWAPTTAPASDYRLAFGQGVLDLRSLSAQATPRTITITMGAGQVRVLAPTTLNLTVDAHIRFGQLEVDDVDTDHGSHVHQVVEPLSTATGAPITVRVHLADGQIFVRRS